MANKIPRKFEKLIVKMKVETNLDQSGDVLHVWKNDYGYRALNTRTHKYSQVFASMLRNSDVVEILGGTEVSNLEIERCLTLSTCHISEETARKIEDAINPSILNVRLPMEIYDKYRYGWWVYVPQNLIKELDGEKDIPVDLWKCMMLAWENYCTWLCLDCDGQEVDELEKFDW